jgi:uncharacterized protein YgbK (DUF1537 family)
MIGMRERLAIIADDLTGAMDSSGYFANLGFDTRVILKPGKTDTADVMVVSTDSRGDGAILASGKVRAAAKSLKGMMVYKKIDSTLRGNIAAEIASVMEELAYEKTIVAPAFPAMGRITENDILLVKSVPVAETPFASDPISPVTESSISRRFEQLSGYRVGLITLTSIKQGAKYLCREINRRPENILICDTKEEAELKIIAAASALARRRYLLCGSGGLARELYIFLKKTPTSIGALPKGKKSDPALLVVGSRHPLSAHQLQEAHLSLHLPITKLEIESLDNDVIDAEYFKRIVTETVDILHKGKSLALTLALSKYESNSSRRLPIILAELAANVLAKQNLNGLFLCGGDTAAAVCRRLEVAAIRVGGEVEPGIPWGLITGGMADGVRIITKAGGFGSEKAIVKSMTYLEEGNRYETA